MTKSQHKLHCAASARSYFFEVIAFTWKERRHGLFYYHECANIVVNEFQIRNDDACLYRFRDSVKLENASQPRIIDLHHEFLVSVRKSEENEFSIDSHYVDADGQV